MCTIAMKRWAGPGNEAIQMKLRTGIYKAHSTTMLQAGISSLMEYRVNFGVNLGVCTLWIWARNDNPLCSLFISSIETEVQKSIINSDW